MRRWSSGDAAKAYCGLRAVMLMECYIRSIPVEGYAVGTIKLHATGNGRASKQQMIEAAWTRWGVKTTSDDLADALAILSLAIERNKITMVNGQASN